MSKQTKKTIPKFKSESEEREFWSQADFTDYLDMDKAQRMRLSNLKPSTTTISIRFPDQLLERVRILANQQDVPYQSLIKVLLSRAVSEEERR